MQTSLKVPKCERDFVQSECLTPEEAEFVDALGNTDPNANWGAEPNFDLNLSLTSPSNPRPPTETSKLHGGNKKGNGNKGGGKPGAKGAVTDETRKSASTLITTSPGERDDPSQQKSKIPALCHSQTAVASMNSKGDQRLKFPNPKSTPTFSPKTPSPKPHRVDQTTIACSPRMTERFKTQMLGAESASITNPRPHTALTTEMTTKTTSKIMQTNQREDGGKEISPEMQSPRMLHLPVSPKVQKGCSCAISPKLAKRTPTITAKTPKPHTDSMTTKSGEQASHDSRTHNSQNQRAESAQLSAKTLQTSSVSPKPSTQRKATGTKSSNTPRSKENLDSKDSSAGSCCKTSSKSISYSKAMTVTKDSLDSKASLSIKTTTGSRDSLDSKSGSASKTSWGSKNSLDSKTWSNSKASPNSRMGSGESLDSKTAEIKASSKSIIGSKDDPNRKSLSLPDPTASFNRNSSSKPGPTRSSSKTTLMASGSKMDLVGPISPSSSRTVVSGSKDDNLRAASSSTKPSPDPRAGSSREVQRSPGSVPSNCLCNQEMHVQN
ncbi:flocculation protein FLO11-like [Scophthalmus maximus]|uniref:flocculation protein FLO11-like n=1 Tax=Scophthalmus maximus TaxID=52904 RepID=UPI001FA831A0|nr:flocculation protein FLO11-like [Scophthalmus maximus]